MPSRSDEATAGTQRRHNEQVTQMPKGSSKAVSSAATAQRRSLQRSQEEAEEQGIEEEEVVTSKSQSPSRPNLESDAPSLSEVDVPPLPNEVPPSDDDGWEPAWDSNAQCFYFYNRITQVTQWENPRVPTSATAQAPGVGNYDRIPPAPGTESSTPAILSSPPPPRRPHGGYNPAIHGDYDPNASYAQDNADTDPLYDRSLLVSSPSYNATNPGADPSVYAATGFFNRFTGKWQASTITPENFNDENKSKRQMNAYFDVDAAANSHDGRSLKAERAGKKLSKEEVKAFKAKRREKKEEKRRAWLRD